MTQAPNINGVTLSQITSMMHSYERVINFYNKKYNFDINLANPTDRKKYESALRVWDFAKQKRDELKAAL